MQNSVPRNGAHAVARKGKFLLPPFKMRPTFSGANWVSFKCAFQSSVEHLSSLFTVYVKQL